MATIATLNLYHWAEPDIAWLGPGRSHSPQSWSAKRRWLERTLREIGAEAVALQEVVSVAALRETAAAAGFSYCATVADPIIEPLGPSDAAAAPRVYRRAVNAVISRSPIQSAALTVRPRLAAALGLHEGRHLRRPPVVAELTLPRIGPAVLIGVHLKSPGAAIGDTTLAGAAAPATPEEAAQSDVEALARSHAASAIQRLYEAAAIRHAVDDLIRAAPNRPVIVLGDFNDAPDSATLRTLLAHGPGAPETPSEPAHELWRLVDAHRLAPPALRSDARAPTHRDGAVGRVLDFALVSAALHPWRAERVGAVAAARVYAPWFDAGDPAETSDHAAVCVTLAPSA